MEKISGILPSSRRVSSVDMQSSSPVRPGTPTFGRAVGVSTLAPELVSASSVQRAMDDFDAETPVKKSGDPKAEIAQTMADKFFAARTTQAPQAPGIKEASLNLPKQETQSAPLEETEFTPPGSLLNLVA